MTPIERCARAIGDQLFGYVDPADTPKIWAISQALARACLAALLPPSEGMVEAGEKIDADMAIPKSGLYSTEPANIFTAMIRQALDETGETGEDRGHG